MPEQDSASDIHTGHLLVASTRLLDPNFQRTVVLVIEHNTDGSVGLVLNRPSDTRIKEIWDEVSDTPCPGDQVLRVGGPVHGPLMALHGYKPLSEKLILPGVHFSAARDHLEQLVIENRQPASFFVGYAGWGPGQLEAELGEGSWLVTSGESEHVFTTSHEELWDRVTQGIAASVLLPRSKRARVPDDPTVN